MKSNTKRDSLENLSDIQGSDPSGTARQKDICMAVLLSDPSNFAALFNTLHIFHDKILPEDLEDSDSRLSTLRFADFEEMARKGQTLYRDNIKIWKKRIPVYLGIESQTHSVPTLPVRSMNYDAANYDKQINAVRERNRRKWQKAMPTGLSSGEFMERFTTDDTIHPVVTAVLYTGEEWNCAKNLNELFAIPEHFMKDIPSWPLHIIHPQRMSDEEIMKMDNEDMKFFISVIKYSKDREKIKELISTKFHDLHISAQIGYITGVITNTKWLQNKFKENRDDRKEKEDMGLAFDEWEKELRAEGILEGEAEGISKERQRNVLAMYAKKYSAKQIAALLKIDLQEVEDIISALRA